MALINTIRSALASADAGIVGGEQEALTPKTDTIERPEAKSPSRKAGKSAPAKPAVVGSKKPAAATTNKTDIVLKKLRLARGATIAQLLDATGWQPHSMRGFLAHPRQDRRVAEEGHVHGRPGSARLLGD